MLFTKKRVEQENKKTSGLKKIEKKKRKKKAKKSWNQN